MMTKKIFTQPEWKVIGLKHNDIITDSITIGFDGNPIDGDQACAPDRFNIWDVY